MKKNNTPLLVGVVFAVLAIGWFATRDSHPSAGIKTLAVPTIAKADIQKLTITMPATEKRPEGAPAEGPIKSEIDSPAHTVVLTRDGADFVVADAAAPTTRYPVEMSQLDAVLDAVADFSPGARIANDKSKLADFEIEDGKALHLVVEGKGGTIDLLFGRAAKDGGTTVRRSGSGDVFVAKGRLGALIKKDLTQWRKKSIVGKKADDFTAVSIRRGTDDAVVLTATTTEVPGAPAEDGSETPPTKTTTWSVTTPATLPDGFRLDSTALGRVAASLATLRAVDFASADVGADATGLAGPHTVVTGTLAGGGSVVLHVGKADDKKRIYATIDGDAQVYLLPEYAAKNLDKTLDDFRELTLMTADVGAVQSAVFTAGTTRVVVKKAGDAWSLVEPKTAPKDFEIGQIANVVQSALRLRGTRIVADAKSIGSVTASVELKLIGGGSQVIRFGGALEGSSDILASGADGLIYAVNAFSKTRYEKPLELFKKPPPPPPGMGGMGGGGGISGLESLPPDVRKKLEASLRQQGLNQ